MLARHALFSVVVGAAVLGGCAYHADSFRHADEGFRGARATVACLDVAIDRRADPPGGGTVLAYEFGNRCGEPTLVDLATVAVYGRREDGVTVALTPDDPARELRPMRLDARASGRDAIIYANTERMTTICVDAASIAHARPAFWMCFPGR